METAATKDPKEYRKKHGLNQTEFWKPLGVTQSAGSRYESGRNIPKPVKALMSIVWGTEKQAMAALAKMRRDYARLQKAGQRRPSPQ